MDEKVKKDTGEKPAVKKVIGIVVLTVIVLAAGIGIGVYRSGANPLQEHLDLGRKYLEELNYEQALVEFEEAIRIDPKCVDAYLGMAETYESMGNDPAAALTQEEGYEKSLETYDRLLEQAGEDERALAGLSDSLRKYIDILMAEQRYDEIRRLAEKYGNHALEIDFTLILGKLEESEGEPSGTEGETSAELIQVSIQKTDIKADSVFNNEGYGSITVQGAGNWWDASDSTGVSPQAALVDGNGNFVFPYKSTYLRYCVSDGIVSLTEDSPYYTSMGWQEGDLPTYCRLDGSSVLDLETDTKESTVNDPAGYVVTTREIPVWYGGPMQDSYAAVVEKIISESNTRATQGGSGIVGIGSVGYEYRSVIVDANGAVTCTLPEEYNQEIARGGGDYGEGGFDTKCSLGTCGEGLFAAFENSYDENWNYSRKVMGYMDPIGNMAIDLAGSGFTDAWPFYGGLAAVRDENSMLGFMDQTGTMVIPCSYEVVQINFSEDGVCAVQKDGKWGYIDRDNNVVIPFEYDGAYGAGDGLAAVVKDGKCGMVDYGNNMIVPLEYDDISSCEEGVAYAVKDGVLYIISKEG